MPALLLLPLLLCGAATAEATAAGVYGHWRRDAQGLPSYVYTRDQLATATASSVPPSSSADARHSTEHSFQLGNDRVVLIGNNYGSFRLRADEGGPKYLTGGWTENGGHQFGGGYGHLFSRGAKQAEKLLLSSYYSGGQRERHFGIGYARSTPHGNGFAATHTAAVPVGDDPVVLLQVDVRHSGNRSKGRQRLAWREVWGSLMMHLDPAWSHTANRSTFTATHYLSRWSLAAGNQSLIHRRKWLGLTAAEAKHLRTGYTNPTPKGGSMWDQSPPAPFLAVVTCDGSIRNMTTVMANDAAAYFAGGTASTPSERASLVFNPAVGEPDAALIAATSFDLAPGETARLCYIYGYLPSSGADDDQMREVSRLIEKFRPMLTAAEGIAANVSNEWKRVLPVASVPSKPWLGDEMRWHAYYLRGGLTFDTFYNEYILDQGTAYRYRCVYR